MGYTTDFDGAFKLADPLTPDQVAYLQKFNTTRRMKRNPDLAESRSDLLRIAVGLPIGKEAGYFVGAEAPYGQEDQSDTPDILNYNIPPLGQPGLWCQWTCDDEGSSIQHDEGEKFYHYVEWLEYLIVHFLSVWGKSISGEVTWQGEDPDDFGKIVVASNEIQIKNGVRTYE